MKAILTAVVDEQQLKEAMENFTLKPYPSRIFVWEMKLPEKTQGGLYLPELAPNAQEVIVTEGIVVGVGADIDFCSVGDHVFYAKYSGAKCVWNGTDYRVMNEADLFGKEVTN